jgi:hypothetical protein
MGPEPMTPQRRQKAQKIDSKPPINPADTASFEMLSDKRNARSKSLDVYLLECRGQSLKP